MKLLTLVAVAGVEPAHLQTMPTKDMAAGIHHSRQTILRPWGRLWNTQCRRSCILCPLYQWVMRGLALAGGLSFVIPSAEALL